MDRLDNIIAQKRKLSLDVVQSSRQPLRYFWLRQAQAAGNPRNLGKPNLVEDEENYTALQSTISKAAKTKPQLDNMVLRIMFELNLDGNVGGGIAPLHVQQGNGTRLVNCHLNIN